MKENKIIKWCLDGEKGKENEGKNDEKKKKVSAPKSFYLFIQSRVSEGRGAKKKKNGEEKKRNGPTRVSLCRGKKKRKGGSP